MAAALMQQLIAHNPADQRQTRDAQNVRPPATPPERKTAHLEDPLRGVQENAPIIMTPASALTRCLQEEASAIATAAERLSSDQVEAALALLERCADRKAKLVITGGQERHRGANRSHLLLHQLIPFLNPTDALHGDLGVVAEEDVCLLLSNSGETVELLEVLLHQTTWHWTDCHRRRADSAGPRVTSC